MIPSLPQKSAGLLVPVFAMRRHGDLGIGDTLCVRDTVDFCAAHGFAVLQTLPIHETVGDHSPYNPVSSRALSPALLTLTPDAVPGLNQEILDKNAPPSWVAQLNEGTVKHLSVHPLKFQILMEASLEFEKSASAELAASFEAFQQRNEN